MKNYQKIYNRLVKEIKRELIFTSQHISKNKKNDNIEILEYIEDKYEISSLIWILNLLDEIEGKKCNNHIMNKKEFEQWKKKITI